MFKISNIDIFTKKTTENTFDEPLANQNSKLKTLWFKKNILMNGWFPVAFGVTKATKMGKKISVPSPSYSTSYGIVSFFV